MDRFAIDKLNLGPKSELELHAALDNFVLKWENKAKRSGNDRISRF
jgi:hypothetical protein